MSTPQERIGRIVWPSEAPVDEGRVPLAAYEGAPRPNHAEYLEARIAHPLASIAGELHAIREALAPGAGRAFSLPNGGLCDGAGNGFALYDGPRPGFLWRVELIAVSVTGASAAASVEVYNDGPTPDEVNIVAFVPALSGANPSRGFLAPEAPAIVFGGNPVLVRVLGAVAGAQITCRIQGTSEAMGDYEVEIGISRGTFQVVRITPTDDNPAGGFVLRVEDTETRVVVVVGLNNEAAAAIRDGLVVPEDGPPRVHLADPADVRVFGKQGDGSAAEAEAPPAA